MAGELYLGVDIGGTKCAVILGSERCEILDKIKFPTEVEKGVDYSLNKIIKTIYEIIEKNSLKISDIMGIGISCGGPLDSKRGVIMSPPNLPGWDNIPIVDVFEKEFGLKSFIQNDANACALAEWKFGAGRGYNNVIFLTFGTGLGAGLILDGKLYSGTNDMAGEVGHIRLSQHGPVGYGKEGSFEGFCSGGGIAQIAKTEVLKKFQLGEKVSFCNSIEDLNKLDAKTVAEAAASGDELARYIYSQVGRYLGKGLSILIDILNPEVIILGSIFVRCREFIEPYARQVINSEALLHTSSVCKILPAELGETLGDVASIVVAMQNKW